MSPSHFCTRIEREGGKLEVPRGLLTELGYEKGGGRGGGEQQRVLIYCFFHSKERAPGKSGECPQ